MPDHAHVLTRLDLKTPFPDLMRELKSGSSRWIRSSYQPKFSWQRRYGAFTVSESASDIVRKYIQNQKEHHQKRTCEEEYKGLLKNHKIEFDESYLWE